MYLGIIYTYGKGVNKDYSKVFYWYQKAAEQGDSLAQLNLGIMYQYGKGVEEDYSESVFWYEKAA